MEFIDKPFHFNNNLIPSTPYKDSFSVIQPLTPEREAARLEILSRYKDTFVNFVKTQRKGKWHIPEAELEAKVFNADIFTGREACQIGLVDGTGNMISILEEKYPEHKLLYVKPEIGFLRQTQNMMSKQHLTLVQAASGFDLGNKLIGRG